MIEAFGSDKRANLWASKAAAVTLAVSLVAAPSAAPAFASEKEGGSGGLVAEQPIDFGMGEDETSSEQSDGLLDANDRLSHIVPILPSADGEALGGLGPVEQPVTEDSNITSQLTAADEQQSVTAPKPLATTPSVSEQIESPTGTRTDRAAGVALDAVNFPDPQFRAALLYYDRDSDGVFSQAEIASITSLNLAWDGIADMTGLEHLTSLAVLRCDKNLLTSIDVSRNLELVDVNFSGNPGLTTLDFRANKKLRVAYHATAGETIFISAGMTSYIGCNMVPSHTGNIVIDLEGFYTVEPDGTKTVDLSQVISQTLIAQITENSNTYDPATRKLTIPANEQTTVIAAKEGNSYTFYTNLGNISAHDVTYLSEGNVHDQERVDSGGFPQGPSLDPVRDGYVFAGWFADAECVVPFNTALAIVSDTTVYAGWQALPIAPPVESDPTPPAPVVPAPTSPKPTQLVKLPVSNSAVLARTGDAIPGLADLAGVAGVAAAAVAALALSRRRQEKGADEQ